LNSKRARSCSLSSEPSGFKFRTGMMARYVANASLLPQALLAQACSCLE
jgi:hypothetical protein